MPNLSSRHRIASIRWEFENFITCIMFVARFAWVFRRRTGSREMFTILRSFYQAAFFLGWRENLKFCAHSSKWNRTKNSTRAAAVKRKKKNDKSKILFSSLPFPFSFALLHSSNLHRFGLIQCSMCWIYTLQSLQVNCADFRKKENQKEIHKRLIEGRSCSTVLTIVLDENRLRSQQTRSTLARNATWERKDQNVYTHSQLYWGFLRYSTWYPRFLFSLNFVSLLLSIISVK